MDSNFPAKEFTEFVESFADEARTICHKYFRTPLVIDEKDDSTPVTKADREIEAHFRERLARRFPDHGVIGEEYGKENAEQEFVWVIDPIDGTKAFATGKPLFGTVVGLFHKQQAVLGLIDQAYTRERWIGVRGATTLHNDRKAQVSDVKVIEDARFYTAAPEMFSEGIADNFRELRESTKWTLYCCDCYAYGLLALGHVDLVAERFLGLHDIAGLVAVIEGAGGFVSDWSGRAISPISDGTIVAACNRTVAEQALEILNR